MEYQLKSLTELAADANNFPIWKCGPSDDPDKQYAFSAEFREKASRFLGALRRLNDPTLLQMIRGIDENIDVNMIAEAHDLRAKLLPVFDYVNEISADPAGLNALMTNQVIVDLSVVKALIAAKYSSFDLTKLIRFVEELNDSYARGNYLSTILLIRAIINHIPPIFGFDTFAQVVANADRSTKPILARLEETARPIADLHTHQLIRKKEMLPTRNQIDSCKASLEVLLQRVVTGADTK